jgi:AcrR family transcriptional regulator
MMKNVLTSEDPPRRRTGRRPGDPGTRDRILAAARASFAEHGYDRTTIRGVAGRAGVDPALVHYFFGAKDRLFGAAMELPLSPADLIAGVLAGDRAGMGERLARTVLRTWDDPDSGPPLIALVRGAASHERSATLLREFIAREILDRISTAVQPPERELRAALIGVQVIGLAMARYVIKVPAVADADPEALVRWLGPTLQRYLGDS